MNSECISQIPDSEAYQYSERSRKLPPGLFSWIKPLWRTPDTFVLDHSSLDAFLFLRFLKMLIIISLVGCVLTWPILLPLHATGGGGLTELDRVAFGNLVSPRRYYVHALLACIYFGELIQCEMAKLTLPGFILYMVVRECIYCVNIRQAYLMAPFYAERQSSRTVLFTCVPREYLYEARLRATFGNGVKKVWLPRDSEDLEHLVKERDQTAFRLEKAEIALIMAANVAKSKAIGDASKAKVVTSEEEVERRRRSAE
jgi:hypothetical protein